MDIEPDDILLRADASSPEIKLLKSILYQMVENERRRVRNEFIRTILLFGSILMLLFCAGLWLSINALRQINTERAHNEQSLMDLIKTIPIRPDESAGPDANTPYAQSVSREAEPDTQAAITARQIKTAGQEQSVAARVEDRTLAPKENQPSYGTTLTIPIKGDIPLRAPIPRP